MLPELALSAIWDTLLPEELDIDWGILLGGFSDLWRSKNDPPGEFWIVTDRGPNGQVEIDGSKRRTFPVPEFTPLLLRVKAQDGLLQLLETLPLVGESGRPVSGLPNLESLDGLGYDFRGEQAIEANVNGLDVEGLVRTPGGDFWLAEEYRPSLIHVDRSGRITRRFIPRGQSLPMADCQVIDVLPAIYSRRQDNRGFEGLAISPDGRTLFAALQSPLANPTMKVGQSSCNVRILAFDLELEQPSAEYVYRFDAAADFEPDAKPSAMKIGAIVATGEDKLLVLERTDSVSKVYLCEVAGATNLLPTEWHGAEDGDALEAIHDLAKSGIEPLKKQLIVDLSKLDGVPEKLEGLAVIDDRHLAVINDNDFGFKKFDRRGIAVQSGIASKLIVVELSKPLW